MNKGYAEYVKWLGLQESLLRQKTHMKWFQGDHKTKYFHSVLKEKRRKLQINRIKNQHGRWIQGEEHISRTAIKYYENLFNLRQPNVDHGLMDIIPQCITNSDNAFLSGLPDEQEIKDGVFSMSVDSAAGLNGYSGKFFQTCGEIIKIDMVDYVLEFLMATS